MNGRLLANVSDKEKHRGTIALISYISLIFEIFRILLAIKNLYNSTSSICLSSDLVASTEKWLMILICRSPTYTNNNSRSMYSMLHQSIALLPTSSQNNNIYKHSNQRDLYNISPSHLP